MLLAAHSDVVAVDGQPWTHDPFALHIEHGRAYGRGTADMKGFLATALTAVTEVDHRRLRRPLHVALSSDEELGCLGVRPLLDTLAGLPVPPAAAVVGEPTMLRVADRHKGKAAARVHVRGRAAHSSLAPAGVNAVAFAARLVTALLELQDELAAEAQDDGYTVPHATIGIGPICGGVSVNIVPDHCRLDVEVRALPEQDPDELMGRMRARAAPLEAEMRAVHPDAAIEFEPLSSYPGLRPAPDPGIRRGGRRRRSRGGGRLRHGSRPVPAEARHPGRGLRSGGHGPGPPGRRVHRRRPAQSRRGPAPRACPALVHDP